MEFGILGPLEVSETGQPLDLGGAKQRALLAVLLLNANQVVSTDRLIDALWAKRPPETAAKALQVYVSQLRKTFGAGRLLTRAPGYLVQLAEGELDLDRFEALVLEAREAEPISAAAKLHEALALWRGPPLAEFSYEAFAETEIRRLDERRLACLEERISADLAIGRHAELVGELEALVEHEPLRERLRSQLMLALYRSGRHAEALETYQQFRRTLVDQLGIEPGKHLRELEQAILQQDFALDFTDTPEGAVDGSDAQRSAFVGRKAELEELVTGLDDAVAGRGRLFLLIGEPGIGKSRLMDEMARRARTRGMRVLIGRCWEAGGAPAYWPWVQSLRIYIRETPPEKLRAQLGSNAAEIAQIFPEIYNILPGLPDPPPLDAEGARFRLFDATSEFLRNASAAQPIMIVLDDLHAADVPSLLLLQFLARTLDSTHMLFVGALRDVDPLPREPVTALLTEVGRERATRRLPLVGLSEVDVAEYLELTASEFASPALVAALHTETDGNPLFVGETVRLLSVEGTPSMSRAGARLAIPQSVRNVIARRLAHLSAECNRVLVLASVLGREFAVGALAEVSSTTEDELLETLDEAMAARVITDLPTNPGSLRFAHVLIRDTLYEGLTTARRVRLHRLAFDALETRYGEEPRTHLAELAYHAIAGSNFDKGLSFATRAGDRELSLLAYEEAARLFEIALDALDLSDMHDETAQCGLLLSLGEAEARAGNTPAAKTAFLKAAQDARASVSGVSSLARRLVMAGGSCGRGRGTTRSSCRSSKKGSRPPPTRTSSCEPGSSLDSRERYETNHLVLDATN